MKSYLCLIVSLGGLLFFCSCKKNKDSEQNQSKDSLEYYKQAYKAANYFSIETNENAQRIFYDVGVNAAMQKVQFDLNQLNTSDVNPLLPETKADERAYMNKAEVLNNKWIIMDYYKKDSDGMMTGVGEVLVEYRFHADRPCEFFVLSTQVYE